MLGTHTVTTNDEQSHGLRGFVPIMHVCIPGMPFWACALLGSSSAEEYTNTQSEILPQEGKKQSAIRHACPIVARASILHIYIYTKYIYHIYQV